MLFKEIEDLVKEASAPEAIVDTSVKESNVSSDLIEKLASVLDEPSSPEGSLSTAKVLMAIDILTS